MEASLAEPQLTCVLLAAPRSRLVPACSHRRRHSAAASRCLPLCIISRRRIDDLPDIIDDVLERVFVLAGQRY